MNPSRHHSPHHSAHAAIIGAGLSGRLLALALCERGWQVSLYDRDATLDGQSSCAYVGAGMLSPIAELEEADPIISQLGWASLSLWQKRLQTLNTPVYFQQEGTLVITHPHDQPELTHFRNTLQRKLRNTAHTLVQPIQWNLDTQAIRALEPELNTSFHHGMFLPNEGQIDNRQLLNALTHQIQHYQATRQLHWYGNYTASNLLPSSIASPLPHSHQPIDWVFDCRGLGAKPDTPSLRGIRGEVIRVHAPNVTLNRPVRLMHPRYPLYIVPRENHHYVIGATSIESEDTKPITVQSALELLSAAFSVHSGFAEATILEFNTQCRPTLPNHLPQLTIHNPHGNLPGYIQLNGLYRHGFLIIPQLIDYILQGVSHDSNTTRTPFQLQSIPAEHLPLLNLINSSDNSVTSPYQELIPL